MSKALFWKNIARKIKKYYWGLLFITVIFFITTAFFINTTYGNGSISSYLFSFHSAFLDKNFLISLSASFLEDLFSFIFITIFLTIITAINTPDPKSEDLHTRVSYLLNGENIENRTDVITYMKDLLKEHTIYSPEYEYNITYGDYDSEIESRIVYVRTKRTIINMLNDDIYIDRNFPYKIKTDKISKNGIQGEIISAKIIKPGKQDEELYYSPQKIILDEVNVDHELNIDKGSSAISLFQFWIYHKCGEKYIIEPQKYTHKIIIYVRNESSSNLEIQCHSGKQITIPPKGVHPYKFDQRKPVPIEIFTLLPIPPGGEATTTTNIQAG